MDEFKLQVKKSFQTCKNDINSLDIEIQKNNSQIQKLETENKELRDTLLQTQNQFNQIQIQLLELTKFINDMKQNSNVVPTNDVSVIQETTSNNIPVSSFNNNTVKKEEKKDPYEALLEFKAKNNKREVLKQKITSMIGDGINLAELKFLFVDHFKYCSKATFYNYLKELELERFIKIERESSKNYVYPLNNSKNYQSFQL